MFFLRVFIEPFLNFKFRFFKYFVSNSGALSKQILLAVFRSRSELRSSGWSRSRYFLSGAEIFYPEPEPKKKSGAGAEEKWFGYATLPLRIFFIIILTL